MSDDTTSAPPPVKPPAMTDEHRWGEPITPERQAELDGYLQRWAAEETAAGGPGHGERAGPFAGATAREPGVPLTGADVFYLATRAIAGGQHADAELLAAAQAQLRSAGLASALNLATLHLEGASLHLAHLEHAYLKEAHLEHARLFGVHLEDAVLARAHLEHATLIAARLERAELGAAYLEGANLHGAHLTGTHLEQVHLERANLGSTHLEGAYLHAARLDGASLHGAHLAGTRLEQTHLEGADLRAASFDKGSRLHDAMLTGASFDLVTFEITNLTVVDWGQLERLGDERTAREPKDAGGKPKDRAARLREFKAAVRANRVLSVALRAQGLNEDGDRFDYRARFLQRQVLHRQGQRGRAFGSWLLDVVSGYGYRPLRSVSAYVLIIALFAGLYLLNAQFAAPHLTWDESLVLSISSFHGRGFFSSGIALGNNLARIAAGEAILGLLLEITFIATFTQRFFAR
jgi:uncharacterized protein YjbI with pentapeptide repeats